MAVYQKPNSTRFMGSVGAGADRERKSFKTREDAEAWEVQELVKREVAKAVPEAPKVATCWTLNEAFEYTSKHVWSGHKGEYKAILNAQQALSFFGADTPTSEITSTWVVEYMEDLQDSRNNAHSTLNKKLSALSVMLKSAEEFGKLKEIPRLKRYKEGKHRIAWYSDIEERDMLVACTKAGMLELRDFITVGIYSGFRRAELLGLTLDNYSRGELILHAGETKNDSARSIPTDDKVKAIIAKAQASGQKNIFGDMTDAKLRREWEILRSMLGRSEDPKFIVHVMRHTCATRLAESDVTDVKIMRWMGHTSMETTLRYTHLRKGSLASAAQAIKDRVPDLLDVES